MNKENLTNFIEHLKNDQNFLNSESIQINNELQTKIYVKELDEDFTPPNGVTTFSDEKGEGYLVHSPLDVDNEITKDDLNELIIKMSNEETKGETINELMVIGERRPALNDEQKDTIIRADSLTEADKLTMLTLLDQNRDAHESLKDVANKWNTDKDKALEKSESNNTDLSKVGGLIEKLGNAANID